MRTSRPRLSFFIAAGGLSVLVGLPIQLAAGSNDEEPPVAGRTANFAGAIGSYRISTSATPIRVRAQDPLVLTVRIAGSALAGQGPVRPNLKKNVEFSRSFRVQDMDSLHRDPAVWEFRYELRPLRAGVREIPAVRFDYYKPGVVPPEKGYRTTYARPIAIEVQPRETVSFDEVSGEQVSNLATEPFYEPVTNADLVLRHDQPPALPGLWAWCCGLLVPPAACLAGCVFWRLRHPRGVRPVSRHSGAARAALRALAVGPARGGQTAEGREPAENARQVATIVEEYIKKRTPWQTSEFTSGEVAVCLRTAGCPDRLVGEAAGLLHACDAVRFSPGGSNGNNLFAAAANLINGLEEEWPERSR
jgi:BatD DUF11 like domain